MGRKIIFESGSTRESAEIDSTGVRHARIRIGDILFDCELVHRTADEVVMRVGRRTIRVHQVQKGQYVVGGRTIKVTDRRQNGEHRTDTQMAGELRAVMPGMVVKVMVREGQEVEAGTPVLVLEAMKMENEVKSPGSGKVKRVHVKAGDTVETDALLVEFE